MYEEALLSLLIIYTFSFLSAAEGPSPALTALSIFFPPMSPTFPDTHSSLVQGPVAEYGVTYWL